MVGRLIHEKNHRVCHGVPMGQTLRFMFKDDVFFLFPLVRVLES